jgi:hypothetical protein
VRNGLFFDERFEAPESAIPLGGNAVEVIAKIVDGLRVELEQPVATGADATNNSDTFEDAQVLGDGLARELRAVRKLRDLAGAATSQFGEQRQTGAVAEGGERAGGVLRPVSQSRNTGRSVLLRSSLRASG